MLFHRETFSMGTTTRNHIEVANLVNFGQVWIFDPDSSQCDTSNRIKLEPATFAERDLVLVVIRNGTLSLISDQQSAVRQFN